MTVTNVTLKNKIENFKKQAVKSNLVLISSKSDTLTSTCLLFRKVSNNLNPNKQTIVEVEFGNFDRWVDKLKNAFTECKNKPKNENVWMVSDDSTFNGVLGLINCLFQEPGGDRFRCIFSDKQLPRPIDFSKPPYKDLLCKDLAINVFKENKWGTYR